MPIVRRRRRPRTACASIRALAPRRQRVAQPLGARLHSSADHAARGRPSRRGEGPVAASGRRLSSSDRVSMAAAVVAPRRRCVARHAAAATRSSATAARQRPLLRPCRQRRVCICCQTPAGMAHHSVPCLRQALLYRHASAGQYLDVIRAPARCGAGDTLPGRLRQLMRSSTSRLPPRCISCRRQPETTEGWLARARAARLHFVRHPRRTALPLAPPGIARRAQIDPAAYVGIRRISASRRSSARGQLASRRRLNLALSGGNRRRSTPARHCSRASCSASCACARPADDDDAPPLATRCASRYDGRWMRDPRSGGDRHHAGAPRP